MNGDIRFDRLILQMDDVELEQFCRSWADKKTGYFEVKRFAGPGDMGRDVVGFFSDKRHDGAWDNYQCKQYLKKFGRGEGILAVAKVCTGRRRDISKLHADSFLWRRRA